MTTVALGPNFKLLCLRSELSYSSSVTKYRVNEKIIGRMISGHFRIWIHFLIFSSTRYLFVHGPDLAVRYFLL